MQADDARTFRRHSVSQLSSSAACFVLNTNLGVELGIVCEEQFYLRSGLHIFTSWARNVCLQHERQDTDDGTTSPTAHSKNSVIQTVYSFLICHLGLSTSEILVCAGGGHFEDLV